MRIKAVLCVVGLLTGVFATPASADTNCPAFPEFPDENCTGPASLNVWTGPLQFRTNAVIENTEIRTPTAIYIAPSAAGITFRNVRFVYTGPLNGTFTVINNQANNVTFDRVEIDGRSNVARALTGTGLNTTVRNSNIHHAGNGLEIDGPMLVEDNYIHDIFAPAGTDWHPDGIQTPNTGTLNDNITIRHNTIIVTDTSTGAINIMSKTSTDTAKNVLIEDNLLAGGGYTMYTQYGENYQVLNNRFSTRVWPKVGYWGLWYGSQQGITRQGNTILETGATADK